MALVIDKIVEDSLNCKQERPASLESLVFSIDGYQVYVWDGLDTRWRKGTGVSLCHTLSWISRVCIHF